VNNFEHRHPASSLPTIVSKAFAHGL
jgi:hypothetical protein